jgi:hypothetical protein
MPKFKFFGGVGHLHATVATAYPCGGIMQGAAIGAKHFQLSKMPAHKVTRATAHRTAIAAMDNVIIAKGCGGHSDFAAALTATNPCGMGLSVYRLIFAAVCYGECAKLSAD